MNCANHPEVAATAFCRTCGKPLCEGCQRPAQGTIFCEEHAVVQPSAPAEGFSPYTTPYVPAAAADAAPSPGLAFLLGLIPGVGAIYNGQYAKGLVHVVIFGLLMSIADGPAGRGLEPVFVLLSMAFYFYMPFEAYHTASKRRRGEAVDEFSSIFPMQARRGRGFPVGPVLLIALGVVLLLNTLEVLPVRFLMLYGPPVFLIVLGCYWLYVRVTAPVEEHSRPATTPQEAPSE
jgi:hypothetical protein